MRHWVLPFLTAAFVMAGEFKGTQAFVGLPFDLTFAFAAITAVAVVVRLVVSRIPPQVHAIVVGFALLVPAVFLVSATVYGEEKVARLFTLTLLATVAPVILARTDKDVERFLWAWTAVASVIVVMALLNPQTAAYAGAPVTTEGIDTIVLGDAAGLVVVVMALATMWKRLPWFVSIAIGGVAILVLLQSGSRGPLLATVIAVLAGIVLPKVRPRPLRSSVVVVLSAVGLVAAFAAAPIYAQARIAGVLQGRIIAEGQTRLALYQVAWESVGKHPFGIGWGGYEQIAFLGYRYPHNIVLESLAEAGVILGGLFVVWLLAYFFAARRSATTFTSGALFTILTYLLIEVQFTGDINSNRTLFYAIGLTAAVRAVADHRKAERMADGAAPDHLGPRGHQALVTARPKGTIGRID